MPNHQSNPKFQTSWSLRFKVLLGIGVWSLGFLFLGFYIHGRLSRPVSAKIITVKSRNLYFKAETLDEGISHGATIDISKPVRIVLIDGGSEARQIETAAETVNDLLYEQKIALAITDEVTSKYRNFEISSGGNQFLAEGMTINIDRIADLEVTETAEIPFEIKLEHDPTIYYGREEVISQGILGEKQQLFLITYKNGVEVKRNLLREKILRKSVAETRRFGTKIEIEESREGRASWYVFKKCMCAAHPFYEFGRYVRVTALASGKSIIVKINDRGPDLGIHPDRVIDLDSAAYKELAPLGSGTIAVRAELLR